MLHNGSPDIASPSSCRSPSPSFSPATSSEYPQELRPLIGQSIAARKELEDGNFEDNGAPHHHAIFDDPELEGLTLYEKKAALVNRELDSHGMGRYQWYIFFLCGFGYLIDLLYAQAFGLVEPAIQQEFGFGGSYSYTLLLGRRLRSA